ncbi:hypothetical protein G6F68_010282 [Rhizopus microsporus]|nr:hypothetical protein G6F68_010282 [Rhizopus microsporus]
MNASDPTLVAPPWHGGERLLQTRAGVAERMAQIGPKVVRDYMPDQHREFFAQLPFLVMGSVAARGDPPAHLARGGRAGCRRSVAGRPGPGPGGGPAGYRAAYPAPQPHERPGCGLGRQAIRRCRRAILRQLPAVHPVARFPLFACAVAALSRYAARTRWAGRCGTRLDRGL